MTQPGPDSTDPNATPQPDNATPQPMNEAPEQPYTAPQQPYGDSEQPYAASQQPYGAPEHPYAAAQQPYGAPQQGYPQAPYPGQPMPMYGAQPQQPEKTKNVLGIIALVLAVLGLIFSCIKGALFIGWILLPISFILGIVSLFLKNKKKGMGIAAIVVSVIGTIVAAIAFMAYVVVAADDALNAPPTQTGPDGEVIEAGSEGGPGTTRENPLPLGSTVESDEWAYTINSVDLNATEVIMAENPYNDAPAEGQQYIMVNLTATYKGNDPEGEIPFGSIDFVSPDGNTFEPYATTAVTPESFDEFTTLYEGASTSGNIAISVPSAGIEQGVLAVSPDMLSSKSFVAVQ